MRKIFSLAIALLFAAQSLLAGTVTGTFVAGNGVGLKNGTLTWTLNQSGTTVGGQVVTTQPFSCATSTAGQIVGLPNPLAAPVLNTNTSSGTLGAGTYYVVLAYYNAGDTLVSPEASVVLSATGTVIVSAPAIQPSGATGYKVFMSSTPGSETLQATNAGWGSYSRTTPLGAGSAMPASNTTACSFSFNDTIIPSYTKYKLAVVDQQSRPVPGYPDWFYYSGSGPLDQSTLQRAGNLSVVFPNAIVAQPSGGGLQSIAGPLAVTQIQSSALAPTPPMTVGSGNRTVVPDLTVQNLASTFYMNTANLVTNTVTNPAAPRSHTLPDPGYNGYYLLTPTPNAIDCTTSLPCTLTTKISFDFAGANGSTSSIGWDTFATNGCVGGVITGSNTQKGVCKFKAAVNLEQQAQNNLNPVSATTITLTPLTTTTGNLLVAVVSVLGAATITGCSDGSAYTLAKRQQNSTTLGVEIWYRQNASALSGGTLTCTASGASVMGLQFYEYSGAAAVALDQTQGGTGTGTSLASTVTGTTAQASELVFAAGTVAGTGVALTTGTGFAVHNISQNTQSTGISGISEGSIANAVGTFTGPMTIGSSAVWAEAIATFKAASATAPTQTAQRGYKLPADFVAPMDFNWTWFNPQAAGTGLNVQMGISTMCTASGATDDAAFNTATTVTAAVPTTTRALTVTPIAAVTITGCLPGQLMHIQPVRVAGSANDNYEREIEAYNLEITTARQQ